MAEHINRKLWKESSEPCFKLDLMDIDKEGHMVVSIFHDRITGKKLVYKKRNGDHWDVYVSKHGFKPIHFAKFSKGISESDITGLKLYFVLMFPNGVAPTHYELSERELHI